MTKQVRIFNNIAKVYGFFFKWQIQKYRNILENVKVQFNFSLYKNAIDIGCGTGALCRVLQESGLEVTGLDPAEEMLAVATKKIGELEPLEPGINFVLGDVLEGLQFPDKSFDIVVSAYIAHGMAPEERQILYSEMVRVGRDAAILLDYNENRSLGSDIIEWAEGGDYFNFIKVIKSELTDQFGNLQVIITGKRSAMYICKIE
jgi:ubiquinone/menaquinone biosynthesis C-methylase UbiE